MLSLAFLAPGSGFCGAATIALGFASGETRSSDIIRGTYLDVAAEVPLGSGLRLGFAANSNAYDRDGYVFDTSVRSLAPSWRANGDLHVGAYYERFGWHLGGAASVFQSFGAEALYAVPGNVDLGGYLGAYRGADWGSEASTNFGLSARVATGESVSLFAYAQRDTFVGGWWQDTGIGGHRTLGNGGLGVTLQYAERRNSGLDTVTRSLVFGGLITLGRLEGSAPEFRARHCVMCELPD